MSVLYRPSYTPSQLAQHARHASVNLHIADQAEKRLMRRWLKPEPVQQTTNADAARLRRDYETLKHPSRHLSMAQKIIVAIAAEFDLTPSQIAGEARTKRVSDARHVAASLIADMTKASLPTIGRMLGGRDHTTILNSQKRFAAMCASEAFRNRIDQIKQAVSA